MVFICGLCYQQVYFLLSKIQYLFSFQKSIIFIAGHYYTNEVTRRLLFPDYAINKLIFFFYRSNINFLLKKSFTIKLITITVMRPLGCCYLRILLPISLFSSFKDSILVYFSKSHLKYIWSLLRY